MVSICLNELEIQSHLWLRWTIWTTPWLFSFEHFSTCFQTPILKHLYQNGWTFVIWWNKSSKLCKTSIANSWRRHPKDQEYCRFEQFVVIFILKAGIQKTKNSRSAIRFRFLNPGTSFHEFGSKFRSKSYFDMNSTSISRSAIRFRHQTSNSRQIQKTKNN